MHGILLRHLLSDALSGAAKVAIETPLHSDEHHTRHHHHHHMNAEEAAVHHPAPLYMRLIWALVVVHVGVLAYWVYAIVTNKAQAPTAKKDKHEPPKKINCTYDWGYAEPIGGGNMAPKTPRLPGASIVQPFGL